ncbi:braG domain protein [Yersinia aldovae 670-83]|nr:braG domain protein [Yersinia aldovae 670-83]
MLLSKNSSLRGIWLSWWVEQFYYFVTELADSSLVMFRRKIAQKVRGNDIELDNIRNLVVIEFQITGAVCPLLAVSQMHPIQPKNRHRATLMAYLTQLNLV